MKVRHANTVDAAVVGFTGPRAQPWRLVLVPTGERQVRLLARLAAGLSVRIGQELGAAVEPARSVHLA
ncbi:hypothetical protein OH809_42510 [Streptomyces sp. NBC_00873]|uniref:hypothetical protein n=1 Tax=unclassified Streptomyces TaxID=2593676 RepID=UPI003867AA7C|nr:hypothetical protein OH809_01200 [Streptomyces sp. NBC_00873]WSY96749.1 hypothetical protein OH809_42510 [Streptomyces sp. NBC_00873]WTA41477.1 hypothetical protein OH821_01190 [Streptomyces sp. NBC_00842]WTA48419.1 hypothetical protein OH821_42620 [Streptomyces sp. NBC_00842]